MKLVRNLILKLLHLPEERKYNPQDFAHFGENVYIGKNVKINHPERVYLSDFSHIHRGTIINSMGGLYLGKYSGISYNCLIYTVDHRLQRAQAIPFDNTVWLKPVIIEDFAIISSRAVIAPGVRIGEGAVVGIGAVVIHDVPPLAIVIGNPAKVMGYRDKEEFENLKKQQKFSTHRIPQYIEQMPLMYKSKYREYLSKLNLL